MGGRSFADAFREARGYAPGTEATLGYVAARLIDRAVRTAHAERPHLDAEPDQLVAEARNPRAVAVEVDALGADEAKSKNDRFGIGVIGLNNRGTAITRPAVKWRLPYAWSSNRHAR